jgi:hypothetical protein
MRREKTTMRERSLAAAALIVLASMSSIFAQAPSPWQQPAAALAAKIADLVGSGQVSLSIKNLSSIPTADLPAIQKLLTDDLHARGIREGGSSSASTVRVTLSESATERLWVAEVVEGNDNQVEMVDAGAATQVHEQTAGPLMLRRTPVFASHSPVLATLETPDGLAVLEPDEISIYARSNDGWRKLQSFPAAVVQFSRDPRGILRPSADNEGFDAWFPGQYCAGRFTGETAAGVWTVDCRPSDDPWLIYSGNETQASTEPRTVAPALPELLPNGQANTLAPAPPTPMLRAFYDAARDYFTGVIVPNPAVNLPPFYSAAYIPGPGGEDALLIGGIDGPLQLLKNGALSPVAGARDWGSDFAALRSNCGGGTQIVASGSGEAISDSLRAYGLSGLEVIPESEPLTMSGTVTALWSAPGGSVMAVVRNAPDQYEVDRVSASCN